MGSVTFTPATPTQSGGRGPITYFDGFRAVKGTIVFTAATTYATGGDTLALASVGLQEARRILIDPALANNRSGLSIELDATAPGAPKVRAYDTDNTEVPNGTNLTARQAIPVWVVGT